MEQTRKIKKTLRYKLLGIPYTADELIDKAKRRKKNVNILLQEDCNYGIGAMGGMLVTFGRGVTYEIYTTIEVDSKKIVLYYDSLSGTEPMWDMVQRKCYGEYFYKGNAYHYNKIKIEDKTEEEAKSLFKEASIEKVRELSKELQKSGLEVKINNKSIDNWK